MKYPHLFSEGYLGKVKTKNRIVMSATGHCMANADGSVSDHMIGYYSERAKGGAGTIITGVVCVDYPSGKSDAIQHRIDQVDYINGLARLAREVHRYGAILLPQLQHAGMSTRGYITKGESPRLISPPPEEKGAHIGILVEKSMLDKIDERIERKVLTTQEVKEIIEKFVIAAVHCQFAGCDGIELHAAHGYLMCQFLTPFLNNRTDEYGGSLENRMRFVVEVIKGIRKECGENFIIGIRMPVHHFAVDGLTDEESEIMAKTFEAAGCDFIDCSGGIPDKLSGLLETQTYPQGARVVLAEKIKKVVKIPVFAVGKLRDPDFCEKVLADGKADYICSARNLIADPYWPMKAKAGKDNEILKCISCLDGCFGSLGRHQSLTCVLNPLAGYEYEYAKLPPSASKKRVVIVGGGIAGMQAAITATKRGHEAIILEKSNKLGGQMILASVPPHKQEIGSAAAWFVEEVARKNIKVEFNTEATIEKICSFQPDEVILAAGALPNEPPINGIKNAIQSWRFLDGSAAVPENKRIVIIGGGIVGCEVAKLLAEKGNSIVIIEMLSTIANGMELTNKADLETELKEKNVKIELNCKVLDILDDKVLYMQNDDKKHAQADVVLLAAGQHSCGLELAKQLDEKEIPYTVVGDANKPGNFMAATRQAFFAAINL